LQNPAYTGDFAACRTSHGKYHTIWQGRIVGKGNGVRYIFEQGEIAFRRWPGNDKGEPSSPGGGTH
jgi:hypothetical protein